MRENMLFLPNVLKAVFIMFCSVFIMLNTTKSCNSISTSLGIMAKKQNTYNQLKYYDTCYPKFFELFNNHNSKIPDGWKQIDFDNNKRGDYWTSDKTGFEATAFVKRKTVAIVIRGLHIKGFTLKAFFKAKDGESARSIFYGNMGMPIIGKIPEQFNDALKFYKLIKAKFPQHKIVLVGKSLGGGLAELLGAIYGETTYTFASPGMSYAIPKLSKNLQKKIAQNRRTKFTYIKTYHNLNDPCGSYGEHIGLTFVYPPIKNYKSFFYDVHGDIKHFASPDAISKIREIPKEWKSNYTAAIIYYDPNFKEKANLLSLHKYIKIRYKVNQKDFFEAEKLIDKMFGTNEQKEEKIVISNFKSTAY